MSMWSEDEDQNEANWPESGMVFYCSGLKDCMRTVDRLGKMCTQCQAKSGITYGDPQSAERHRWMRAMGYLGNNKGTNNKSIGNTSKPKIVARRPSKIVSYPSMELALRIIL